MKSIFVAVVLVFGSSANAIDYPGGAKVVTVDSGSGVLVAGKHMFQLLFAQAILHKESGWAFEDKAVVVKVDVQINGVDFDKEVVRPCTARFARVYEYEIGRYEDGRISIPFSNLLLLDWYPTRIGSRYLVTGVEIDVTIAKRVRETAFNHVITALARLTRDMRIPMNPFEESAKQLGSFTEQLLDDDFLRRTNAGMIKFASMGVRFSPLEGLDSSVWVKTDGTFAVLMGRKQDNDKGHVNILDIGDSKFSYKQNAGLSVERGGSHIAVANDYLVFLVNAWENPERVLSSPESFAPLDFKAIASVNSNNNIAQWHISPDVLHGLSAFATGQVTTFTLAQKLDVADAINKERIITRAEKIGLDLKEIRPPDKELALWVTR